MTTSHKTPNRRSERIENLIQIGILLLIGGMAGAASFTHVHDWTMANSPEGTDDWFGWANAVISELTPTAAGLEIRRRKRHHHPIGYPMAVLIAAAILSLAAQFAQAKNGVSGWLLAAVPALAFLALSKLVLSRSTPATVTPDIADQAPTVHVTAERPALETDPNTVPLDEGQDHTETAVDSVPAELLTGARMAAFTHHRATGEPITVDALADHLGITRPLAAAALHHLNGTAVPDAGGRA
jgi:hypothetical protein